MGWWGKQIEAGDPPLDARSMFEAMIVGCPYYDWEELFVESYWKKKGINFQKIVRAKKFTEAMSQESAKACFDEVRAKFTPAKLTACVQAIEGNPSEDYQIRWQVLGVLIMRYGVAIPTFVEVPRARPHPTKKGHKEWYTDTVNVHYMLKAAALNDEWANESDERKAVMQSFIEDLEKYVQVVPPVPTELTMEDEGLFAKCFKQLDAGETGLVNERTKDGNIKT